jgi:ribosomal protein L29
MFISMKAQTLREQSKAELEQLIEEKRGALHRFRFEAASREAKNYRVGRALRREIAQALTVIAEQERTTNV